jgi:hypothetical protein
MHIQMKIQNGINLIIARSFSELSDMKQKVKDKQSNYNMYKTPSNFEKSRILYKLWRDTLLHINLL